MTSTCTIEATDHAHHEHVHASHQMFVKQRLNAHGEVAKRLRRCTEQIPTIDYNTCPAWLRDNDFIRDGYRKPGATFGKYLASIVHIHNETGNIWTHLVGAFIFLVVFGQLLFDSIPSADKTILGVYALCAACCMLNSAYYHTFCCQSKHAYQTCMMIDLSGICAMITGSFYPLVYSCFSGDEFYWTRVVYLTCITVLGTICAAVSFLPYFSQAHCRPYRTALYGSLGMLGFVPYLHELCHFGLFHERTALITPPLLSVFAVYFTGAIIFVSRIPERFSPGKFDLLFQSHQLWHVFVFLGAWTHFCGCYHILQVLRSATEGVPAL